MLVYGDREEHDRRLQEVLQRFQKAGLTLRKDKCKLGRKEVKWFGQLFSAAGMRADPDKVKVI